MERWWPLHTASATPGRVPLLTTQNLSKSFGNHTVLKSVSLAIHSGERIGLVGVNGSGKSTLAKILAGVVEPDSGAIQRRRDTSFGYLAQEPEFPPERTVRELVEEGLGAWATARREYEVLSRSLEAGDAPAGALERQGVLAEEVERLGG